VPVVFVTGSDTDVGKTRVAGWLAQRLARDGFTQVIKPVESGVRAQRGVDARLAAGDWAEAHTLVTFAAPLAPLTAAKLARRSFNFKNLLKKYHAVPLAPCRVIEGAGGLSVPLDEEGRDWADFIQAIQPEVVVVVVPDRLGAINQARLTMSYLRRVYDGPAGVWLNAVESQPSRVVAASNRAGLRASGIPLLGQSRYRAKQPEFLDLVL
jgi:dethiobiotin synthetase